MDSTDTTIHAGFAIGGASPLECGHVPPYEDEFKIELLQKRI